MHSNVLQLTYYIAINMFENSPKINLKYDIKIIKSTPLNVCIYRTTEPYNITIIFEILFSKF